MTQNKEIKSLNYKHYKIQFNDYQMSVFNSLDLNGHKRFNLMSIYAYLIKHSQDRLVSKSLSRLHAMYIKYHKKMDSISESISKSYFCKLINQLEELNLLEKENRKVFILQNAVDKKVDKKVDKINSASDIEESEVSEYFDDTQILNVNFNNNNYNIFYTSNEDVPDTNNDFDLVDSTVGSTAFIANIGDTLATKNQLEEIAHDLYKMLGIKSRHIKTEVANIIWRYAGTIYLHAARSYLKTVILDKKLKRDKEREEFKKNYIYNKNLSRTSNNGWGNYLSNNSKRLAQMEANRQESIRKYESMDFDQIGVDWQDNNWCM